MRIIAFANQKGGTGKTTCAIEVCEALFRRGYRVLLVSLCNPPSSLLCSEIFERLSFESDDAEKPTIYEALLGSCEIERALDTVSFGQMIRMSNRIERIDYLPTCTATAMLLKNALNQFESRTANVELPHFCILDCPSAGKNRALNALATADEVIYPTTLVPSSIKAIEIMNDHWDDLRNRCSLPRTAVRGLLVNQVRANRVLNRTSMPLLDQLAKQLGTRCFQTQIRHCEALRQAHYEYTSVFTTAPDCRAAIDFDHFVAEYLYEREAGFELFERTHGFKNSI